MERTLAIYSVQALQCIVTEENNMGTTRFFTGTGSDGALYDFVEESPDRSNASNNSHVQNQIAPTYKLRRDGSLMKKISDTEFTVLRSGVKVRIQ